MGGKLLKFLFKITQAIQFLHNNGMIHRDIKPENILITKNYRPKLADFGTSVYQADVKNTFCGTFEYMAPEIYQRKKQTEKVDIWAIGILLYEMLHKWTPFKGMTVDQIISQIQGKLVKFTSDLILLEDPNSNIAIK